MVAFTTVTAADGRANKQTNRQTAAAYWFNSVHLDNKKKYEKPKVKPEKPRIARKSTGTRMFFHYLHWRLQRTRDYQKKNKIKRGEASTSLL